MKQFSQVKINLKSRELCMNALTGSGGTRVYPDYARMCINRMRICMQISHANSCERDSTSDTSDTSDTPLVLQ